MSLKVLTSPRCPKCKQEDMQRFGYRKDKGGSEYGCRNPECRHIHVVPTLRLTLSPAPSTH